MEPLAILCVLLGVVIIAVRAPLIFAPRATVRLFDRLIATNAGVRALGLLIGPLALALVVLARGGGLLEGVLQALGWLLLAATLWLLAAPASYRRVAHRVLAHFEESVDMAIVRILGFFASAIGAGLIYLGIIVL